MLSKKENITLYVKCKPDKYDRVSAAFTTSLNLIVGYRNSKVIVIFRQAYIMKLSFQAAVHKTKTQLATRGEGCDMTYFM